MPLGMSGKKKSTEGESIGQAEVLLGLARGRWRKGGACGKVQDGGSQHVIMLIMLFTGTLIKNDRF